MLTNSNAQRTDRRADNGDGAPSGRFTPEEIAQARTNIHRAFELGGWVATDGSPVCPQCGKSGRNRIRFHADGGYKCFSAGGCVGRKGGAVDLLIEKAEWGFPDAVGALLGRFTPAKVASAPRLAVRADEGFKAARDNEVFDALVDLGDVEAAGEYYSQWHIDPAVVAESGAAYVTDVVTMQRKLTQRFGRDRLVACGLVIPREGKSDFWVVNERYPVIEPHRDTEGHVVGIQTRPSRTQQARYAAHTAYARARRDALGRGEDFREPTRDERYVPKFMSLRGGVTGVHLIGCGLPRLAGLGDGATVYIVEGFKDMLAMRTLGFEAYAIPGAGVAPPPFVIAELARFRLAVTFDADEGGDAGTKRLTHSLARGGILAEELLDEWRSTTGGNTLIAARHGLEGIGVSGERLIEVIAVVNRRLAADWRCWRKRPPEGMDVTDVLVSKRADAGCGCPTCNAWRDAHPHAA